MISIKLINEIMPANLPIAVHAFIRGGKILLIERVNTGFNDNKWSVPAGRLEVGESITQAVAREVKEEVGLSIDSTNLKTPLIMNHRDSRGERLYVFFTIDKWNGEIKNMEPEKCNEVRWYDEDKLPENLIEHIKYSLEARDKGLTYIEYGF